MCRTALSGLPNQHQRRLSVSGQRRWHQRRTTRPDRVPRLPAYRGTRRYSRLRAQAPQQPLSQPDLRFDLPGFGTASASGSDQNAQAHPERLRQRGVLQSSSNDRGCRNRDDASDSTGRRFQKVDLRKWAAQDVASTNQESGACFLSAPSTATSAAAHLHSREQPDPHATQSTSMINRQLEPTIPWDSRPGRRFWAINRRVPAQPVRPDLRTWSTGQLRGSWLRPPDTGRERARPMGVCDSRAGADGRAGHSHDW